jgi:uncharacterized protein with HEPN domain
VKPGPTSNRTHLAYAVEHLQGALRYAQRGRAVFFDEAVPDTSLLVEGELRKAYESLNRLGQSFWNANPGLPRDRVGEIRERLTHEYAEVNRDYLWGIVTDEVPALLRRLARAKVPANESRQE